MKTATKRDQKLIRECEVQKPSEKFRTTTETTIPINMAGKQVKAQWLERGGLPQNLLSTKPFIKKLGPILLDKAGTDIVPNHQYKSIKRQFPIFRGEK